ncbi:MAG TPA: hypothetical protein VFZ59_05505 [Verrucomicrobiae bacterium]|nr:hypothetical protein [Verrucomicrobiae bacterium]
MKFAVSILAMVLLATACRPHKDSADDRMQKGLSGTWIFEGKYARGGDTKETITVAPDGRYILVISMPTRTNGPRTVSLEGTLRVENGFLIDTVTKDSQTNAPVPTTNRIRIIRIDGRELVLDYERLPGTVHPTNQIVLLKQTK